MLLIKVLEQVIERAFRCTFCPFYVPEKYPNENQHPTLDMFVLKNYKFNVFFRGIILLTLLIVYRYIFGALKSYGTDC